MRVALLGIVHESNTFAEGVTGLDQFRKGHWHFGEEIIREYKNAFHEVGGMIEAMSETDIQIVPIMYAEATPGGTVTKDAYEHLMSEMFGELKKQLPVDGCLVVPHGAGVCEAYPDMDGHWLGRLREMVGKDVPIIGTIDPHANVSQAMIDATNALVAYKTNPHVDQRTVGKEAGMIMSDTLLGRIKPVQLFASLPLAISIEQQLTEKNPCKELLEMAKDALSKDNIVSTSIVLGFPYADVKEMGSSVIVIADDDVAAGKAVLNKLTDHIICNRSAFNGIKQNIKTVVSAWDQTLKPLLLLDMGDNVGGGSPGNSVYLLDQLEDEAKENIFHCVFDPVAVQLANAHAIGDSFELQIGQRPDSVPTPTRLVTLEFKGPGSFDETTPRHGGQVHFDMGPIAIVKTAKNHVVMLTSLRVPPYSLRQLTTFGINPQDFDAIVAKGVNAPIAAYKDVCPSIVQVNTPGVTAADMTLFHYDNRRVPLYPFEEISSSC
jgi:microcystin degradation protein MlrC